MKIMHLSDLHIGKSILEQSLIEDQKYILNQIIDIIKINNIHVVLIAGDVYDKAIPNIDAVKLFSNFLSDLYKNNVRVFVISGNHDSKDRLSFGNELFINNGIYIEGNFDGVLKKVELRDEFGIINIYMLPFIKPSEVKKYFLNDKIDSYNDAVSCIINNTEIDTNVRNIIMVHQFVTGSGINVIRSDSESISLGGIDNIDVSLFEKFDYVAMGHIHRGQKLVKDTIRYAGSPLKYSFSEVNHKKCVPIIEFSEKNNINIELQDLKPIRDMRVIRGSFEELFNSTTIDNDDYINAVITDDDYVFDAIGKLRSVYKNILKLEYSNSRNINILENNYEINYFNKIDEIDMFSEFYKLQNNIELDDNRKEIITNIIDEIKFESDI